MALQDTFLLLRFRRTSLCFVLLLFSSLGRYRVAWMGSLTANFPSPHAGQVTVAVVKILFHEFSSLNADLTLL